MRKSEIFSLKNIYCSTGLEADVYFLSKYIHFGLAKSLLDKYVVNGKYKSKENGISIT